LWAPCCHGATPLTPSRFPPSSKPAPQNRGLIVKTTRFVHRREPGPNLKIPLRPPPPDLFLEIRAALPQRKCRKKRRFVTLLGFPKPGPPPFPAPAGSYSRDQSISFLCGPGPDGGRFFFFWPNRPPPQQETSVPVPGKPADRVPVRRSGRRSTAPQEVFVSANAHPSMPLRAKKPAFAFEAPSAHPRTSSSAPRQNEAQPLLFPPPSGPFFQNSPPFVCL